jgi:hypothetical protein
MSMSGREIDRKLRLTATVLGAATRKELAAAFRRTNPATLFDVERAHKWLQGRARPREEQLYDDWAKLLDLGCSGRWIAECDIDAFLDALCARYDCDRGTLERQERDTRRSREIPGSGTRPELGASLAGTFIGYTHAWSRYFRPQLICGELSFQVEPSSPRLAATWVQNLPTGAEQLHGPVVVSQRTLSVELYHSGSNEHYSMHLFRPPPPASVTAGYMSGLTFISPEAQLTASRIVLIRLPATCGRRTAGALLPAGGSMSADLAALGLSMRDPAEVDRRLTAFLMTGHDRGIDQFDAEQYAALTELFDRNWLSEVATASA